MNMGDTVDFYSIDQAKPELRLFCLLDLDVWLRAFAKPSWLNHLSASRTSIHSGVCLILFASAPPCPVLAGQLHSVDVVSNEIYKITVRRSPIRPAKVWPGLLHMVSSKPYICGTGQGEQREQCRADDAQNELC